MRALLIILALFVIPTDIAGQRYITGKVMTGRNTPLIGATVRVVGTARGTVTDIDGKYSLYIPSGSTQLAFSYTGFGTKISTIGVSNIIDVTLTGGRGGYLSNKRWSMALFGGHSVTSAALTSSTGLTKDYGGQYWGGIKIGFDFVSRPKIKLGLDIGAAYRDYGFRENNSHIPYITGLLNISLRRRLFWRISMLAYGGGEYGKIFESNYYYYNPTSNLTNHNLYLHQNDILSLNYGGGLCLSFNRLNLDFGFERNIQMDNFDLQYGKTIGGRFSNVALRYFLF